MRITNSKHVPWFLFVLLATIAACLVYVGNFHPERMPGGFRLPPSLLQTPSEHRSVGGTPLGLIFGSFSFAVFIFAALLSLRKKIPLWRIGTVQRWLRAHIWLTLLTVPLVILHSGFRLGGPMTMVLMTLYTIVMVSGIYGLILQHYLPRLMKERLPAETVFEQIPHIRAQLCVAAGKMRDSFRTDSAKTDAGAPAPSAKKTITTRSATMATTQPVTTAPVARPKTTTGSAITAEPVAQQSAFPAAAPDRKAGHTATPQTAAPEEATSPEVKSATASPAANAKVRVTLPTTIVAAPLPTVPGETIGTPTARVQSEAPGTPVAREAVPAGTEPSPTPPIAEKSPTPIAAKPVAPAPPKAAAPKPAAPAKSVAPPPDPASEEVLAEFIERQILPYLGAKRGDRFRFNNARYSDDAFRLLKIRVAESYLTRVEEIQAWCDERRMLDLQTRLQHWLHGWLFLHVPISFLLLMLTAWHAFVTLFYY